MAQRKPRHSGIGAVIWDTGDDTVTGAAVGACYEWIAEAAVRRVAKFLQTVGTYRGIRCNLDSRFAFPAGEDRKTVFIDSGDFVKADRVDNSQWWRFHGQGIFKYCKRVRVALDFDLHSAWVITHPARQAEAVSQPVDKRAKTDPLDNASNDEMAADHQVGIMLCLSRRSSLRIVAGCRVRMAGSYFVSTRSNVLFQPLIPQIHPFTRTD